MSVYSPPVVALSLAVWPFGETANVVLRSIHSCAGAGVGTAVVQFAGDYAQSAASALDTEATITRDGTPIFRGLVTAAPRRMGVNDDLVTLVISDDKVRLEKEVVGRMGVGTVDVDLTGWSVGGFKDVGFDLVFNKNGEPNQHPGENDFATGMTLSGPPEYWTLYDILEFLCLYYTDSAKITLADAAEFGSEWDRKPYHMSLGGLRLSQAIDVLAQTAGQSWALIPHDDFSEIRAVTIDAPTVADRTFTFLAPGAGETAEDATEYTAIDADIVESVMHLRDEHLPMSALEVRESTLRNYEYGGIDPLLVEETVPSASEYTRRWGVDGSKYTVNSLGYDLISIHSKPRPWLMSLCTRLKEDGSGYITAAELDADKSLRVRQRLEPQLWIGPDVTAMKLVTSGYRIDCEKCKLDLKDVVKVRGTTIGAEDVDYTLPASPRIWLTIATVLLTPKYSRQTGTGLLSVPAYQVAEKPDAVPESRYNAALPDPTSSDPNAVVVLADAGVEDYVDVQSALDDAAGAMLESMAVQPVEVRLHLPTLPEIFAGDRLDMTGRGLSGFGLLSVHSVRFDAEEFECEVEASNVTAFVDPARYIVDR